MESSARRKPNKTLERVISFLECLTESVPEIELQESGREIKISRDNEVVNFSIEADGRKEDFFIENKAIKKIEGEENFVVGSKIIQRIASFFEEMRPELKLRSDISEALQDFRLGVDGEQAESDAESDFEALDDEELSAAREEAAAAEEKERFVEIDGDGEECVPLQGGVDGQEQQLSASTIANMDTRANNLIRRAASAAPSAPAAQALGAQENLQSIKNI